MKNNIESLYLCFKENLPDTIKDMDGQNGGCGEWAIELYKFYEKYGYQPIICELNKGIHYWIRVENYVLDSQNIKKNVEMPSNQFSQYIVRKHIKYFKDIYTATKRIKKYSIYNVL